MDTDDASAGTASSGEIIPQTITEGAKEFPPYINPDEVLAAAIGLFARIPSLPQRLLERAKLDKAAGKSRSFFDDIFIAAPRAAVGASYYVVGYRLRNPDEWNFVDRTENVDFTEGDRSVHRHDAAVAKIVGKISYTIQCAADVAIQLGDSEWCELISATFADKLGEVPETLQMSAIAARTKVRGEVARLYLHIDDPVRFAITRDAIRFALEPLFVRHRQLIVNDISEGLEVVLSDDWEVQAVYGDRSAHAAQSADESHNPQ